MTDQSASTSPSALLVVEDSALSARADNRSYPVLHEPDWEPWDEPGDVGWRCRCCGATTSAIPCPVCDGQGTVEDFTDPNGPEGWQVETCVVCGGTGEVAA